MSLAGARTRRVLTVLAAALAVGVVALGLIRVDVRTGLTSFLPEGRESLASYQEFGDAFGAEPMVVLVETDRDDGAVLASDRMADVLRLEGELSELPGVANVYGPATMLNQVAGRAKDLVLELMGRRDAEVSLAKARARERGATRQEVARAGREAQAEFDARYGPLLVSGLPGGLPTLGNQQFIDAVVYGEGGAPRPQWRLVVPRADAIAIMVRPASRLDTEGTRALLDRVDRTVDAHRPDRTTTTVTGTPAIVAALSDRAVADAPRLAALAIGGLALCFLAAFWIRRSRRLVPLAVTLAALAVSLAIFGWLDRPLTLGMVAFSSVLLGIGSYYPTYFLTGATRRTVAVVAAASAASLATLWFSPMPLVRDIGLLLGVGVVVVLLLSLALSRRVLTDGVDNRHRGRPAARGSQPWARVALAATTLVAAWGWWLMPGLDVAAEVDHFAGGLSQLEDARHAEDLLDSAGEVDVVLSGGDTMTPEAVQWMRETREYLAREHGDVVRAGPSPATLVGFLGEEPNQAQVDAALRLMPDYLTGAVLSPDRSTAVLSYGIRLDDIHELDDLRNQWVRELPEPPEGYEVELVGLPLVLVDGQELVSEDRHLASLLGIAVAGVILLAGLRHRTDAVRAVLAAVLATGLGFWLLDVTGRGLDPITIALGALTVAVGAEFTVVRAEASRRSSRVLGLTLGLVAATSAVGYLALLGSGLPAVRGFGVELAVTVLLAYLAARVVVAATVRSSTDLTTGSRSAQPRPDDPARPVPQEALHA